jgi:hypothetical protein
MLLGIFNGSRSLEGWLSDYLESTELPKLCVVAELLPRRNV